MPLFWLGIKYIFATIDSCVVLRSQIERQNIFLTFVNAGQFVWDAFPPVVDFLYMVVSTTVILRNSVSYS